MSTRAVIQISKTTYLNEGNPNNGKHIIQYYHHCDGYTSFLGIELIKIILDFIENNDPKNIKSIQDIEYYLENKLCLSYEKENETIIHGDIEYFYFIDFDGGITLTRFKRNWDKDDRQDNPLKWKDSYVLFKAEELEDYYKLLEINYSYIKD